MGSASAIVPMTPFATSTATSTQPATTDNSTPSATPTISPTPGLTGELLTRINTLRASLGLAPYVLNDMLSAAALNQAQWMVSTGIVVHIHPDGSTPTQRAEAAGYRRILCCSEIIYMGGIATLDDAWNFWMTSKIHYAELTSPQHTDAGIGTASSASFGQAFVVVFAGYAVPTPAVTLPGTLPGSYVVQPGDTLFRIALRFGIPLQALAAANRIGVNDVIYVGQVLVIPQPPTPTPAITMTPTVTPTPSLVPSATPSRTPVYHVVQRGETLFLIARQYGVTVDTLIAANGITNPDRIEVGQVIIIP